MGKGNVLVGALFKGSGDALTLNVEGIITAVKSARQNGIAQLIGEYDFIESNNYLSLTIKAKKIIKGLELPEEEICWERKKLGAGAFIIIIESKNK